MRQMQAYVPFLHELADAAAEAILPEFRTASVVENKATDGRYDPVTRADRNAEAAMRRLIASRHPDHGIVGEEFGAERADAEHVWVLDPIDGTSAFICGLPLWGVLIGLKVDGAPALGMLAQPFLGERFFGWTDAAWRERGGVRSRLRVRPCAALGQAVVSTTSPRLFGDEEARSWRAVERESRLVRYGYDCYAYAMLASGFIDCIVEAGLKVYDIDPLIPIFRGAGGHVANWEGGSAAGGGRVVAAGDARVLEAALDRLHA
jgi:histidinol phosphatase-like enzyme (inositol monophosphatase family)